MLKLDLLNLGTIKFKFENACKDKIIGGTLVEIMKNANICLMETARLALMYGLI